MSRQTTHQPVPGSEEARRFAAMEVAKQEFSTEVTDIEIDGKSRGPVHHPSQSVAEAYAADFSARANSEVAVISPFGAVTSKFWHGQAMAT